MITTKRYTRTAVLCALTLVFLLLGQIIRSNTLSFLVLASFVTAAAVIFTGTRNAVIMYISVSILSFLILPDKVIVFLYIIFFGSYGIIKLYIEHIGNSYIQFVSKTGYFLLTVYVSYLLFGNKILNIEALIARFEFPFFIFIILFILLFNFYDFLYTAVINYITRRIKIKRD